MKMVLFYLHIRHCFLKTKGKDIFGQTVFILYVFAFGLRKQCLKCGPVGDRSGCMILIKMASKLCGGTTPNKSTHCLYSQITGMVTLTQ